MNPVAYIRNCVGSCTDPKCRECKRGRKALAILEKLNKTDQKWVAQLVISLTEVEDENMGLKHHLECLTFNKGATTLISGPN